VDAGSYKSTLLADRSPAKVTLNASINLNGQASIESQYSTKPRPKSTMKSIELKQVVFRHIKDKRDAIQQIVAGYPDIQKITTLEINDSIRDHSLAGGPNDKNFGNSSNFVGDRSRVYSSFNTQNEE
jgi:hypothetical protein